MGFKFPDTCQLRTGDPLATIGVFDGMGSAPEKLERTRLSSTAYFNLIRDYNVWRGRSVTDREDVRGRRRGEQGANPP